MELILWGRDRRTARSKQRGLEESCLPLPRRAPRESHDSYGNKVDPTNLRLSHSQSHDSDTTISRHPVSQ